MHGEVQPMDPGKPTCPIILIVRTVGGKPSSEPCAPPLTAIS
jgi:hypothetical protein